MAIACGFYLFGRWAGDPGGFWGARIRGPYEWTAFALGTVLGITQIYITFGPMDRALKREKTLDNKT